jgi:hypothetical protein
MNGSENETSPVSKAQSDDELSLLDLVRFVQRHGVIILGGTLIGGALGLTVAFALPAQWEASALIQVGQLGGSTPVEPLPKVVARVTQKSFKDDALKRMGILPSESDPKASLLLSSLKVKIEKADLVGVHVRGTTPDDTVRFVDALFAKLVDIHTKITEPTLQHWRDVVEEIDIESGLLNKEIERLNGSLAKTTGEVSTVNFSQFVLMNNILLTRESEMRGFRERKRALQEQINPERTFPTSLLGRIEVSTQPVFPKKHLFAADGLVIGLFIGVLVSLLKAYVFIDKKG